MVGQVGLTQLEVADYGCKHFLDDSLVPGESQRMAALPTRNPLLIVM
jgi:hypothetical protein